MAGKHSRERMKRRMRRRLEQSIERLPEWSEDDLHDLSEALAVRIRAAARVKRIIDEERKRRG